MKFDMFSRRKAGSSSLEPDERPDLACNASPLPNTTCRAANASFSSDASLDKQAQNALDETPEARGKRVDDLRQQVRSGTYEIPVAQLVRILARLLLRRH
jgi:anti-sigma28 factor (negative regulator of flagellin synthesis)